MFSIARHRWFNYLRKKKRQVETECLREFYPVTGKGMKDRYLDRTAVERVYQLLDFESEKARGIVKMRIEGYSFYEISLKFDISESSASVIDFCTKLRIKRQIMEDGIYGEDKM